MALLSHYTVQMVLTLLLTLTARSGLGVEAVESGISDQLKTNIVQLHNMYRGMIKAKMMLALRWDEGLEAVAADWVNQCYFQHMADEHWGENIYRSELDNSQNEVAARGVMSWNVEISYMMVAEQNKEPCCDADYNTTLCCNYQQMVWASTRKVGCALKRCAVLTGVDQTYKNAWFFACLYDPPGNVAGVQPYERAPSGDVCTLCPYIFDRCEKSLCHPSSFCRGNP
ncbi:peptidase inhibitor 16-like [Babylonia areolata]|uniref:peptidase inhibitor 16-like n=1 Tax=Babylonia areolata TaxID=304850 RepID=UPI003FD4F7AD